MTFYLIMDTFKYLTYLSLIITFIDINDTEILISSSHGFMYDCCNFICFTYMFEQRLRVSYIGHSIIIIIIVWNCQFNTFIGLLIQFLLYFVRTVCKAF